MSIDLDIARTIKMEREKLPKSSPYELMVRRLQMELDRTTNKDDRMELEKDIVYLLGMHQLTRGVNRIAVAFEAFNRKNL